MVIVAVMLFLSEWNSALRNKERFNTGGGLSEREEYLSICKNRAKKKFFLKNTQ